MRTRHVLIVAAALAAAVMASAGAIGPAHAEDPQAGTISVSGTGTVSSVPDTATISFGVVTQATTASQALATNSAAAERMIAAIKAAGIESEDLRTDVVSLSPRYSDDRGDEIVGYSASNTVSAKIRNLGRAGAVIDAAVGAGANSVQGPSLEQSDVAGLYREALKRAVEDARAKAQTLAEAGGLTLGAVSSMSEGSQGPIPFAAAGRDAAAAPIEPGRQDVTASVTVVFRAS